MIAVVPKVTIILMDKMIVNNVEMASLLVIKMVTKHVNQVHPLEILIVLAWKSIIIINHSMIANHVWIIV